MIDNVSFFESSEPEGRLFQSNDEIAYTMSMTEGKPASILIVMPKTLFNAKLIEHIRLHVACSDKEAGEKCESAAQLWHVSGTMQLDVPFEFEGYKLWIPAYDTLANSTLKISVLKEI